MAHLHSMNLRPVLLTLWLLMLARVFGGAALLWLLDAPGWAIAAWLMLHLKFNLRLPERARDRLTSEHRPND
jgi:hypothetical protein